MFEFFKSELCPSAFTTASLMLLGAALLGLILGYLLWGRYKNRIAELEDDLTSQRNKLKKATADLIDKQESFDRLDGDYATLRSKNRELEYKVKEFSSKPKPVEAVNKVSSQMASETKAAITSSLAKDRVIEKPTVTSIAPVAPPSVQQKVIGKRGRPAGSKNKSTSKKSTVIKKTTGKRGRPPGATSKAKASATLSKKKTTGKRGRPAGSTNKTKKAVSENVTTKTTGKRGRPAGSKNKVVTAKSSVKTTTAKRGRPAGSTNKAKTSTTVKKTGGKRGRPAGSTSKAKTPSIVKTSTGKRGRPAGSKNKSAKLKTTYSAASLAAASKVFGTKLKANDLSLIEGIGPATSKLFTGSGIKTWANLASKSPDELRAVLKKGGSRFQLLEPKTWPRQARMAASAEWKKLKVYQDKLDGGK